MNLTNKNIILAVSGSIAAYKSPDIVRRLQEIGAKVKVILTSGGAKFITKLSLETVSQNKVDSNLWNSEMQHIKLAKWADLILIAPASANIIANIAGGKADDLLGCVILATSAKLMFAPAMNKQMLKNKQTNQNLLTLKKNGFKIILSDIGQQACGDIGLGRMPEPKKIANQVAKQFKTTELTGERITITTGGTIEKIDPVRYLANFSSGKMGIALAKNCIQMGAKVTLIYANIKAELPEKSTNIFALSTEEMDKQVKQTKCDIFISCAAVADFKPAKQEQQKIKKTSELTLKLIKNIDILKNIASSKNKPFCVGFAAETNNLLANAKVKLIEKKLDIIIANDVSYGFGSDENEVIVIDKKSQIKLNKQSKDKIAKKIMQIIANMYLESSA